MSLEISDRMWERRSDDMEVWKKSFPVFEALGTITASEPHEAEILFGFPPDVVEIGTFANWKDAANMVEAFISAMILEAELKT